MINTNRVNAFGLSPGMKPGAHATQLGYYGNKGNFGTNSSAMQKSFIQSTQADTAMRMMNSNQQNNFVKGFGNSRLTDYGPSTSLS